jgi:hypothetical protein
MSTALEPRSTPLSLTNLARWAHRQLWSRHLLPLLQWFSHERQPRGAREHTRGPVTREGELFCSMFVREDLETSHQPLAVTNTWTISSTSTTKTKSNFEEKICHQVKLSMRRSQRWRSAHWEGLKDKDMHSQKVLEAKICASSEADEPCHRSDRRGRSSNMKTLGRSTLRYLELEASKVSTCPFFS